MMMADPLWARDLKAGDRIRVTLTVQHVDRYPTDTVDLCSVRVRSR